MNRAATLALSPLGFLYAAAMKARASLYQRGIFRTHKIDAPVISVGNITTGGTGKTPLVEWIARELARQERRVCILTRGYGRANSSERVVVSDGREVFADARQGGDEPLLLAENLKGLAAVVADADRVSAARWAIKNLQTEVFVADDAFQHMRLARDLNIVTIDATNPWGNGHLLPAGMLREPRSALRRADCTVIKLQMSVSLSQRAGLESEVKRLNGNRPVFYSLMGITGFIEPSGNRELTCDQLKQMPVVAFCALGNPESFFKQLDRDQYLILATRSFPDHHYYTQLEIDALVKEASGLAAEALITTEKDAVKLRALNFSLPCYIAKVEFEILGERDEFQGLIEKSILKSV